MIFFFLSNNIHLSSSCNTCDNNDFLTFFFLSLWKRVGFDLEILLQIDAVFSNKTPI